MTPWRLLTDDGAGAASGLAADEAMMLGHGRGGEGSWGATLRLYTYLPHCALVGRYQSLEDELDLEACRTRSVEVGRRPTGGGAILMGPDQLGVALATRPDAAAAPRKQLQRFAEGVVAGLEGMGVAARFRSKNDLEVAGRKIAGLGLYLDPRGAVLFHASVLVGLDVALMLEVLRIPGAKLSDKAVARVEERVTTVRRELGRTVATDEVRRAMRHGFAAAFGAELVPGEPSAAEVARRNELIAERYGNRAWVGQQSPRRDARGTAVLKTPAGLLRLFVATHGETIKSVLLTGDYNILPPAVPRLEAALRWCRAEEGRLAEAVEATLDPDDLGVEPRAVTEALWKATGRALELQRGHPLRREGSCYFPEPGTQAAERLDASTSGAEGRAGAPPLPGWVCTGGRERGSGGEGERDWDTTTEEPP